VPTQPPIDGLPLWAQIVISLLIGVATLGVAFKGYFTKGEQAASTKASDPTPAQLMAATIVDMGAIRNLTDACMRLDSTIGHLCQAIDDAKHYERNSLESSREVCQRLRELREVCERLEDVAKRRLS
jgi:hypothetical protein